MISQRDINCDDTVLHS